MKPKNVKIDRIYELLPMVYRQRDAEIGLPLKALLRVITEQADIMENDIAQLYENWFIETCQDWVVPYIGDLVAYKPVHEAGQPSEASTTQGSQLNKILIPRREVANTIRNRRRKGTLALLELLANDVAGWPARAVEFFVLLSQTQSLKHLKDKHGLTVDLRKSDALARLDGPFDELAHTIDVRRPNSLRARGRYNIPSIGLFVWRQRSYAVTQAPAYYLEEVTNAFTFNVLANDTQLYVHWTPEEEPTEIAGEMNLPIPIRRDVFLKNKTAFYGENKSIQLWEDVPPKRPIPVERIVPANLSSWKSRPRPGFVAVDPELGRISYPIGQRPPEKSLWVTYYYGFSADMGGGEYERSLKQPAGSFLLYQVGGKQEGNLFPSITAALEQWKREAPKNAIIEVVDNRAYTEQIKIEMAVDQQLQIRAANLKRPIIRLLDFQERNADALTIICQPASSNRFAIDGFLITGRGIEVQGELEELSIRHCTLVPGWDFLPDYQPEYPTEPSLWLFDTRGEVTIDNSIMGPIHVDQSVIETDPVRIQIYDSILDATKDNAMAVGLPGSTVAHAIMTIVRTTVIGYIQTHAIELAENSIFMGPVQVARRQIGCMRFCYITPMQEAFEAEDLEEIWSRTPRRYNCQPDLVEKPILKQLDRKEIEPTDKDRLILYEHLRVRPQFNSLLYGTPAYCQLADITAEEIKRGADDESEMGVFHNLYQPQRETNLRIRLEEYTPAGMDAGIFFAT